MGGRRGGGLVQREWVVEGRAVWPSGEGFGEEDFPHFLAWTPGEPAPPVEGLVTGLGFPGQTM